MKQDELSESVERWKVEERGREREREGEVSEKGRSKVR